MWYGSGVPQISKTYASSFTQQNDRKFMKMSRGIGKRKRKGKRKGRGREGEKRREKKKKKKGFLNSWSKGNGCGACRGPGAARPWRWRSAGAKHKL